MSLATACPVSKITRMVGGQSLEVAELEIIELESLAIREPGAIARLLKATQSPGFFYLAFDDELSGKISGYLRTFYQDCNEYFAQSLGEKITAYKEGVDRGYVTLKQYRVKWLTEHSHIHRYKYGPGHESFEVRIAMMLLCTAAKYY